MTQAFERWMAGVQARMEGALSAHLPPASALPARLHDAMRYAVLGGGKRVRPLLVFAAGEIVGAEPAALEIPAAAVEMIHAYSLVHDDLPCMDDDTLRRGRPTVHIEFDQATAMLAGDALQSRAFQLLAAHRAAPDAAAQLRMVEVLAAAAGSSGMCGGQQIDLDAVGRGHAADFGEPELEMMHIHKTGALIRAAVVLGWHCGQALDTKEAENLDRYAKCVGLAFQVVDDVLDCDANTATLGKTAGKDAMQGKATYVSAMGLARAKEFAEDLRLQAQAAILPFGARAARLSQLADFIVLRKF